MYILTITNKNGKVWTKQCDKVTGDRMFKSLQSSSQKITLTKPNGEVKTYESIKF